MFTTGPTRVSDSPLLSLQGVFLRSSFQSESVNFQVTVLKVLVSYPAGFAILADLKRDVALLATSGRDWAERTKRLAARVRSLDIFTDELVDRVEGGWRITDKGRAILDLMELPPAPEVSLPISEEPAEARPIQNSGLARSSALTLRNNRGQARRRQRRAAAAPVLRRDNG